MPFLTNKNTAFQECYNQLSSQLQKVIDEQKFVDFLTVTNRKLTSKDHQARKKIIYNLLKDQADVHHIEQIASQWANNLDGDVDQLILKCKIFNIRPPKFVSADEALAFAIDTRCNIKFTTRTETLEEIIEHYEKQNIDPSKLKAFLAIGENGNYFYWVLDLISKLRNSQIDDLAQYLHLKYQTNLSEARRRLNILKKYVVQLPPRPSLVMDWRDYRADINGTIESWYSNRENNRNKSSQEIDSLEELLKKIDQCLPKDCKIKSYSLKQSIDFIQQKNIALNYNYTNTLHSYLATLRSQLNEYSQKNKNVKLPDNWQRDLSKEVQSMPLFFGDNKRSLWKKLIQLKSLIKQELETLETIITDLSSVERNITEKNIDSLAVLYNRIQDNGNKNVILALENIQKKLQVNFNDRDEHHRFFVSGYERAKIKKLDAKNFISVQDLLRYSELTTKLYSQCKKDPQEDNLLRDVAQLSKIVISALAYDTEYQLKVNLICSNLSGYANLISRQQFITRYSVQANNGSQTRLAVDDANERYYYTFNQNLFNSNLATKQFKKTYNFNYDDLAEGTTESPALMVASSYYQIQFLEWFMGKHHKKKTRLNALGAFNIAEKVVAIDWSADRPIIKSISEPRVFVSQPFRIIPNDQQIKKQNQITNKFIGIDIGEYGLAWALIEAKNKQINTIQTGFISDPQQRALKDYVKSWREKQVQSTFTSADTKISRIRKSIVGYYKNQLHDLAIANNAKLCFDYEVDAFESGGNRISKIYQTLKMGDVRRKENNTENKQAWGKSKLDIWGVETTAAGTSQTCSRCKRWANLVLDNQDKVEYQIEPYTDGLYKTKLPNGEVRLFLPYQNITKVTGNDLKRYIYLGMRPNVDGQGIEIVKRRKDWDKLSKLFGTNKPRGNIAIFVCPYTDCHHIADADIQAAFNIAVRGYIKSRNPKRAKLKGAAGINKLFLTEEFSKLQFSPIGLEN